MFQSEKEGDISRQVFFISDGEPDDGKEGIDAAKILKTISTIATVMIGQIDEILREEIASRDDRGQPLHARIEDSGALTEALSALTDNYLESADMVIYSGEGEDETIDLQDKLDGFKFKATLPPINPKRYKNGLVIDLRYMDRFGNEKLERGQIKWTAKETK